jgi:uncharacterized cupin superfamily protein
MANLNDPEFDERRDHDGFRCRRARVGRQIGTERLGLSLWEIPPGQAAYPYHYHLGEEELIVVLSGRPSLREPGGWRELQEGEVLSFLVGEQGAHQIANRTDQPIRMIALSTSGAPDIVIRPDSGTVGAFERGAASISTSAPTTPSTTSRASSLLSPHRAGPHRAPAQPATASSTPTVGTPPSVCAKNASVRPHASRAASGR